VTTNTCYKLSRQAGQACEHEMESYADNQLTARNSSPYSWQASNHRAFPVLATVARHVQPCLCPARDCSRKLVTSSLRRETRTSKSW